MRNWLTTASGILSAIGVAGSTVPSIPEQYKWMFAVCGAVGLAMLGLTAKDFNTHSTTTEVQKATEEKKSGT